MLNIIYLFITYFLVLFDFLPLLTIFNLRLISGKPDVEKILPYECGFEPFNDPSFFDLMIIKNLAIYQFFIIAVVVVLVFYYAWQKDYLKNTQFEIFYKNLIFIK